MTHCVRLQKKKFRRGEKYCRFRFPMEIHKEAWISSKGHKLNIFSVKATSERILTSMEANATAPKVPNDADKLWEREKYFLYLKNLEVLMNTLYNPYAVRP